MVYNAFLRDFSLVKQFTKHPPADNPNTTVLDPTGVPVTGGPPINLKK